MYYVILQKNLRTDYTSVLRVFEDRELADDELEILITQNSDEDTFAYKMDVVGGSK
jgi:hypothetical protein